MTALETPNLPELFRQILCECQELYVSSAQLVVNEHPDSLPQTDEHFIALMDDLHRALLVKVFITICESDRRWSTNEQYLAQVLVMHLWNQKITGDQLQHTLLQMSKKAAALKWYSLVRPFDQIGPLRNQIGSLETLVMRLANLIARVDGPIKDVEKKRVLMIQDELHLHLRPIPIDDPHEHVAEEAARRNTVDCLAKEADMLPHASETPQVSQTQQANQTTQKPQIIHSQESGLAQSTLSAEDRLAEALAELDQLTGLDNIKHEVRTLANFLKIQSARAKAGLPSTELSLHMVFGGNPGTGKTSVARILAKIFGAMGVLQSGHLIETDRSGLVAEYAGQTGPKTNQKIDEALDGVIFIDEAYTLIATDGDDPYGHEAVQTLLKRMEDDRQRLVVILAGYPDEMATLLKSNPGLSSRFSRNLQFHDYSPLELSQIFGQMCAKNHYQLKADTRAKIILGLHMLYHSRDRYFGNGRTVRNLFEHAIRRMANRIAEIENLSMEQLVLLSAEDVEFQNISCTELQQILDSENLRFQIVCPNCQTTKKAPTNFLGQRVQCQKCDNKFTVEWAKVIAPDL